jgi:glycosyltransferase involved in cell wall biosynthesis
MAIKILEVDLNENFTAIPTTGAYEYYRILIKICGQPVNWIKVAALDNQVITRDQIYRLIQRQMSWQMVQQCSVIALNNKTHISVFSIPITVVVCTRNRTLQLAACLQSLLAVKYKSFEIVVVDNAPDSDETLRLATSLNVRYVREDRPGLDWARNKGIQEAAHDIIAFTDDDVCVDVNWLQEINQSFNDPAVMAVTGYVAPAELETRAQEVFELSYGGMGHGFYRRVINRATLTEAQLIRASNFGIGANMSFRKSVFSKIGYFDTALDVGTPSCGGGDIEMFHRLVSMGYTLVYEPKVLIWHTHRQSDAALKKQILYNGKGFGCYLITCVRNRTASRKAVIRFVLVNWFYKWNLRNLVKSTIPKSYSLMELYGMITSPLAYKKSQAHAKKLNT